MIAVRRAVEGDEEGLFVLARDFATSFQVDRAGFAAAFAQVLAAPGMHLAVAESSGALVGYVLGTSHPAFYASGPVAWVEEIMVREDFRRQGLGRRLMEAFEGWAAGRECRLVALATRRAAGFYQGIGYAESATYFRKVLRP